MICYASKVIVKINQNLFDKCIYIGYEIAFPINIKFRFLLFSLMHLH